MAENYKLCPKCNNALDNNVMECPYCGESLGISISGNRIKSNPETVKTSGCGYVAKIFFIVFFLLPLILAAISFIEGHISGIFN